MKTTSKGDASDGLPTRHIEAFLDRLRTTRYSEVTLCNKRRVLSALSRWMKSKNVAVANLDESVIASFMGCLTSVPAASIQFELAVLRMFLAYLRGESIACLPTAVDPDDSAITKIHCRYVDYLRQDRGLAKNSVFVYAPFILDFLNSPLCQTSCRL